MNHKQLERNIHSIGMGCFVKYFDEFSNSNLSKQAMVKQLRDRENYTKSSCDTRISKARRIINTGHAYDALLMIAKANPDKAGQETVAQAKTLAIRLN